METIDLIQKNVDEIRNDVRKILQEIGEVSTQVQLNKASLGRAWKFLTILTVFLLGFVADIAMGLIK